MAWAYLSEATLKVANLGDADLAGASLVGGESLREQIFVERTLRGRI